MGDTIFLAVTLSVFNLILPLAVRHWWTAARDEDEGGGVPTRSIVPFYVGGVLCADIVVLALLFPSGSTASGFAISLALGVLGVGMILAFTTGFLRWPKWALPPKLREPSLVEHDLAVYHVDDEHAGRSGAYYMASCSCGWFGDPQTTHPEADRQARAHQPLVEPPLRRFGER
jgi:hypothetical protein